METYMLTFTLESDATFGRGDGVAGLVDAEVEHDRHGTPYMHGRTLKGRAIEDKANMRVSNASLPNDLRAAIVADVEAGKYAAADVLESLTTIRRQTAMDATGKPDPGSLRAMRAVLRQTTFEADLSFAEPPTQDDLALLAACVAALRCVGMGRNRGRGRVAARLIDAQGQDVTSTHFTHFEEALQ